jgi:hypothetical protein
LNNVFRAKELHERINQIARFYSIILNRLIIYLLKVPPSYGQASRRQCLDFTAVMTHPVDSGAILVDKLLPGHSSQRKIIQII